MYLDIEILTMGISNIPATPPIIAPTSSEEAAKPSSVPDHSSLSARAQTSAQSGKPLSPLPGSPTAQKIFARLASKARTKLSHTVPASLAKRSPPHPNKPLSEKIPPANPEKSNSERPRAKLQKKAYRREDATVLHLVNISNGRGGEYISNKEMTQILLNTVKQYKLPEGSPAKNRIDHYVNQLRSRPWFFKLHHTELSNMVRVIAEDIHQAQHTLNPHLSKTSDADREVARMPTECLIHWMSVIDEYARNTSDSVRKEVFQKLLVTAQDHWEDRRLTFQDMREYFDKAATECLQYNEPRLAHLAQQLKTEIPGPGHDGFDVNKEELIYKTRLHSNDYGRVYNSSFAEALAENPPQEVKDATFRLGNALADEYLIPKWMSEAEKEEWRPQYQQHIDRIQQSLIQNQRSWTNQSPLFKAFIEEKDQEKKADAFEKLLRSPKESGFDCMVIPYVAVMIFYTDPWQPQPWKLAADKNYLEEIIPQHQRLSTHGEAIDAMDANRRAIILEMRATHRPQEEIDAQNMRLLAEIQAARTSFKQNIIKTADAGSTLVFQPAAIQESWMESGLRVAIQYKPNFNLPEEHEEPDAKSNIATNDKSTENKLPQAVQQALAHGVPFSAGLSGSTNLLMHYIEDANSRGANINVKSALVSLIMSTGYNGGHAADDCITTAKLLDGEGPGKLKLDLNFGDPSDSDTKYVTSLKKLFADPEKNAGVADPIKNASRKAFSKTIEYFRKNSHYANRT